MYRPIHLSTLLRNPAKVLRALDPNVTFVITSRQGRPLALLQPSPFLELPPVDAPPKKRATDHPRSKRIP